MKLSKKKVFLFVLLWVPVLILVSCGDSGKVRSYKEKAAPAAETSQPAAQEAPNPHAGLTQEAAPAHSHFQWETPAGWEENRTPSGFRLAAFTIKTGDKEATCTIIPLQGEAGGLKANVSRWLGQITNSNPDDAAVEKLLSSQEKFLTKGNFPAVFVDLTPYSLQPADPSILATILTVQGNSLFIKLTGPKSQLVENKDKFKALCQSFTSGAN